MMTPRGAQKAVDRLSLIRFFPADPGARAVLMEELGGMCESDEQAEWLSQRATEQCDEWPGMKGLWQIYFTKFPPRNDRQRAIDRGDWNEVPRLMMGDVAPRRLKAPSKES